MRFCQCYKTWTLNLIKQDMHGVRVKFQHAEKQNEILQKDNAELVKLSSERGENYHSPNAHLCRTNPHTYKMWMSLTAHPMVSMGLHNALQPYQCRTAQ